MINFTEKTKVWIDRENWAEKLDVTINDAQIEKISKIDKEKFIKMNRSILVRYGYL